MTFKPGPNPLRGVEESLRTLADAAWRAHTHPNVYARARELTRDCKTRRQGVEAVADCVRRSISEPHGPDEPEMLSPPLWVKSSSGEADDVCLLFATLLLSLDVRCRFVAARYGRSWTCLVDYETGDGTPEVIHRQWETFDPVRRRPEQVPDERVEGPVPVVEP